MTQVTSFLNTHRAIVTAQKGYMQAPALIKKYWLFLVIIFRYINSKHGASTTFIIGLSLIKLLSIFNRGSLVDRINTLIIRNNKLSSDLRDFRDNLDESVKLLTEKADEFNKKIEKAENLYLSRLL